MGGARQAGQARVEHQGHQQHRPGDAWFHADDGYGGHHGRGSDALRRVRPDAVQYTAKSGILRDTLPTNRNASPIATTAMSRVEVKRGAVT